MKIEVILFCLILVILFIALCSRRCSLKCSCENLPEGFKSKFSGPAYKRSCEFHPECMWDTARWVTMSDGTEGVCTLHGKACPAFSKNHNRAKYMGLSPVMASDKFLRSSEAGETALDLGMYPTE